MESNTLYRIHARLTHHGRDDTKATCSLPAAAAVVYAPRKSRPCILRRQHSCGVDVDGRPYYRREARG